MDMDVKTDLEELVSKIVIKVIDKYMKEPIDKINEMLVGKIQPSIDKIDELEKKIDQINIKMDKSVPVQPSATVQPPPGQTGGSRKIRQPRNYTSSKKQNRKKQKYSTKRLR
jgi:hypothetical protein